MKSEKPFGGNGRSKIQPQIKRINPQITVTHNLVTNQVETKCNFQNWDAAIGLLIDALRGAHTQRMKEKNQDVVIAKPRIVLPGA